MPTIVSVQTSNERGGGEYANVDLLEALAARGARVKLITNLPELVDGTPVPVREIDLGPKLSKSSVRRVGLRFPLYLWRFLSALRAEARANGPADAVLLHYKKEQLMTLFVPRRWARRVVWAEWGPLPFDFRSGPARIAYTLSARRASRIAAVSRGTKQTLVDAGVPADKVEVIPNLVDVAAVDFDAAARARLRAEWGAGERTLVVGCISRFQRKKRNDVVIDMLERLDGDVLLVMAGDGDEEGVLRERAARFGERVLFLPTPRGYVEQVLSACDVQVFAPSPTEGAPRSVILGQLVARPVVATDGEGAMDLIEPDTGTIVSPSHDSVALARVLGEYRDDPDRRGREGAAGRALALERYDPETVVASYERLLGIA
jgi:glycosyltransferase involved in cell wall biosynthesis